MYNRLVVGWIDYKHNRGENSPKRQMSRVCPVFRSCLLTSLTAMDENSFHFYAIFSPMRSAGYLSSSYKMISSPPLSCYHGYLLLTPKHTRTLVHTQMSLSIGSCKWNYNLIIFPRTCDILYILSNNMNVTPSYPCIQGIGIYLQYYFHCRIKVTNP